jgi:hypothetical protein
MRLTVLALLAPLALSAGCGYDATTGPPNHVTPSRSLGPPSDKRQGIAIPVGQTVVIAGTTLRITFNAVDSDSRCPIEVACVWAGDAAVQLSFAHVTKSGSATLHTGINPSSTVFDGFRITLLSLAPDQSEENPIDPASYVAFVQVTPER